MFAFPDNYYYGINHYESKINKNNNCNNITTSTNRIKKSIIQKNIYKHIEEENNEENVENDDINQMNHNNNNNNEKEIEKQTEIQIEMEFKKKKKKKKKKRRFSSGLTTNSILNLNFLTGFIYNNNNNNNKNTLTDDTSKSISPIRFVSNITDQKVVFHDEKDPIFQPTSEVFTPRIVESSTLKYKLPSDRSDILQSLPPAPGSLLKPNFIDVLRRISVVLYQHISRCEKRRNIFSQQENNKLNKNQINQMNLYTDTNYNTKNKKDYKSSYSMDETNLIKNEIQIKYNLLVSTSSFKENQIDVNESNLKSLSFKNAELFNEENFVPCQYKYTFIRIPQIHPFTSFYMRKIKIKKNLIPSVDEIYRFCSHLFNKAQLSPECSIVCLIYIEKLMECANIPLFVSNWKPILLCGLLLASKVWQDFSSWNIEFSMIYPQFSLYNINKLERLFLRYIKWDLYISATTYAKYYFALRSLTEKKDFRRRYNYTMKVEPPNSKKLEVRSAAIKNQLLLYSQSV